MVDDDTQKQVRHSFVYAVPVAISTALPFITYPVFTKTGILIPEDYGVLALCMVYAMFVSALANLGLSAAYDRNYFKYRQDRVRSSQLLYSILLFVICTSAALTAVTFIFRSQLSAVILRSPDYGDILFWALCSSVLLALLHQCLAYFKNSERAKSYVVHLVIYSIIELALSLYLVAYLRIGVIGLVYARLAAGAVALGLAIMKCIRILPPSLGGSPLVDSLGIAYPLTPRIFLGVISNQFAKYMIRLLGKLGAVGVYSIGQRMSYVVFGLITALEHVFLPRTYKAMFASKDQDQNQDRGQIGSYLTPFAFLSMGIALGMSLYAEEVIRILTPSSFHGAADVASVLAMYYGILFFGKITGNQLIYAKKTHLISALSCVSVALTVGLSIPFIMWWKAMGAAWATLLAGVLSGAVYFVVAQRYYRICWEYRKMAGILLVFFGASLGAIVMRHYSVSYPMRLAAKLVFTVGYVVLGARLGIVTRGTIELVARALRRRPPA